MSRTCTTPRAMVGRARAVSRCGRRSEWWRMSATEPHTQSSRPGKSAKRVFAQMSRASTNFGAAGENVDGRDKPGHDGQRGRFAFRVLSVAAFTFILAIIGFVGWVYSLGPLPLDEARQVSTT